MHHDLHQYVCMSVERDDQGKVTEILFEQNDGSFGSFNGAAVSKDVTKKEPWTDAVSLDDLVDRLWRLIGSRAELTVIPDFRGFDTDRNGVPKLFQHDLQCESCRNEWSEKSAQASLTHTCPRCKSIVHTDTAP